MDSVQQAALQLQQPILWQQACLLTGVEALIGACANAQLSKPVNLPICEQFPEKTLLQPYHEILHAAGKIALVPGGPCWRQGSAVLGSQCCRCQGHGLEAAGAHAPCTRAMHRSAHMRLGRSRIACALTCQQHIPATQGMMWPSRLGIWRHWRSLPVLLGGLLGRPDVLLASA